MMWTGESRELQSELLVVFFKKIDFVPERFDDDLNEFQNLLLLHI